MWYCNLIGNERKSIAKYKIIIKQEHLYINTNKLTCIGRLCEEITFPKYENVNAEARAHTHTHTHRQRERERERERESKKNSK